MGFWVPLQKCYIYILLVYMFILSTYTFISLPRTPDCVMAEARITEFFGETQIREEVLDFMGLGSCMPREAWRLPSPEPLQDEPIGGNPPTYGDLFRGKTRDGPLGHLGRPPEPKPSGVATPQVSSVVQVPGKAKAERKVYSGFSTVFLLLLLLAVAVGCPAACFWR